MKQTELAWAAGFFDGEGSVGCYPYNSAKSYLQLRVQVAQADRRVLLRFKRAVAAGSLFGPYKNSGIGLRPRHVWSTNSWRDVERIFAQLLPYLSQVKATQFRQAIAKMKVYRRGASQRKRLGGVQAAITRRAQCAASR